MTPFHLPVAEDPASLGCAQGCGGHEKIEYPLVTRALDPPHPEGDISAGAATGDQPTPGPEACQQPLLPVTFRGGQPEDAFVLIEQTRGIASEVDQTRLDASVVPWVTRALVPAGPEFYLIAEDETGSPVGHCRIRTRIDPGPDGKRSWHIHALYVDPDRRGCRVAERLLREVLRLARKAAVQEVTLFVHRDNTRAQSLYVRNGFGADHLIHMTVPVRTERSGWGGERT